MVRPLADKVDEIISKVKAIGINHVYFEPPADIVMEYPCLRIKRATISTRSADNRIYKKDDAFDLIWISRLPDDEMSHTLLDGSDEVDAPFVKIRHIRHYVADGMHHDQYKLYY